MDATYAAKVQETFIDLYNKGLIYRGKRMLYFDTTDVTLFPDGTFGVVRTPYLAFIFME